jgi:hypothetical protein
VILPSSLTYDFADNTSRKTQWVRHQICNHLQTIHIGLHLLEQSLRIDEDDAREELTTLRAALYKTQTVMEKMLLAQELSSSS